MPEPLEQLIRRLASGRCEYCRMPQSASRFKHVLDHIIARQHGGKTEARNLALCCGRCNQAKGPNIAGIDPETGELTRLFLKQAYPPDTVGGQPRSCLGAASTVDASRLLIGPTFLLCIVLSPPQGRREPGHPYPGIKDSSFSIVSASARPLRPPAAAPARGCRTTVDKATGGHCG